MRVRLLAVAALTAAATAGLATPASACTGPVCEAINHACVAATGSPCVRG